MPAANLLAGTMDGKPAIARLVRGWPFETGPKACYLLADLREVAGAEIAIRLRWCGVPIGCQFYCQPER